MQSPWYDRNGECRPVSAGGITIRTDSATVRPLRASSSITSSRLVESDPLGVKIGRSSCGSVAARAVMRARLPQIVLISPLCARTRKGCARSHDGATLVA
jgi:hypothetical protein